MKHKDTQSPDEIPPSFLQELDPLACRELLNIFNMYLHQGQYPQSWRRATIIPLLKAGKPPGDLSSCRPISLTYASENWWRGWWLRVREYITTLSPEAFLTTNKPDLEKEEDARGPGSKHYTSNTGWLQPQAHETVRTSASVVLTSATVLREKRIHTLLDQDLPMGITKWLRHFLTNRQARVNLTENAARAGTWDRVFYKVLFCHRSYYSSTWTNLWRNSQQHT